jgi:hypothetical protein
MAHTDHPGHGGGHETRDVDLSGSLRFIVIMTVFLAGAFALMWFTYARWRSAPAAVGTSVPPVAVREGDRLPALPRLQTRPNLDLADFRRGEEQVLTSYAWVDKEQGVVRIPVARAIELLAERGLPAPAPAAAPPAPAAPAHSPAGAR